MSRQRVIAVLNRFNWPLTVMVLLVTAMGWFAVRSASYLPGEDGGSEFLPYASRQLTWILLGLVVFAVAALVPYTVWRRLAPLFYAGALGLVVLTFFVGVSRGGARRWIRLPFMLLQPAELMKIAVILLLGWWFRGKTELKRLRALVVPLIIVLIPMGLIARQPDLGTALVFFPVVLVVLFVLGARLRYLLAILAVCVAVAPLGYYTLKPYQRERITGFLDGSREKAYQQFQSKVAVGSGGLTGKGYMNGTQNILEYLPERHTDFIFSVIAEEWGLLGCSVFLLAYFLLFVFLLATVAWTRDRGARVMVTGVAALLATQFVVNVYMTLGLMPITGLTLPLVSYGGSSMLTSFFAMGLALSVSLYRRSSIGDIELEDRPRRSN